MRNDNNLLMNQLICWCRRLHGVKRLETLVLAAGIVLISAPLAQSQATGVPKYPLGPPPRIGADQESAQPVVPVGGQAATSPVDRTNRQAVIDYYDTVFLAARMVAPYWTGNETGCVAGTTSAAYADATMNVVNYFRAMVGLPSAITHSASLDALAQQTALMMKANATADHHPPSSWKCYTSDGASAAASSNLAYNLPGPSAIIQYVRDGDAGNYFVGHRRGILYPLELEMGTGSTKGPNAQGTTTASNALHLGVSTAARPSSPEFVAWPSGGYVPFPVVYPRWSFSVNASRNVVDFANATVSMASNGSPVGLTRLAEVADYGDDTIVWEPAGLSFAWGMSDKPFVVTINNVLVNGVSKNYTYTVTVVDPVSPATPTFTNSPLTAGTKVLAVHVTELRNAINLLRAEWGIDPVEWTDPTLSARATRIKAAHILEMREAVNAVYLNAQQSPPAYASPIEAGVSKVSARDINELRSFVLAVW
jgi:uncharacterized protein YkwD